MSGVLEFREFVSPPKGNGWKQNCIARKQTQETHKLTQQRTYAGFSGSIATARFAFSPAAKSPWVFKFERGHFMWQPRGLGCHSLARRWASAICSGVIVFAIESRKLPP